MKIVFKNKMVEKSGSNVSLYKKIIRKHTT